MSDLIAFLKARIAEDEQYADEYDDLVNSLSRRAGIPTPPRPDPPVPGEPARVRAENAAKLQIMGLWELAGGGDSATDTPPRTYADGYITGLWMALKEMAHVYSSHPDFRVDLR